ncbi:3-phosphoshikimate 1-carboxyvinyltransferase [Eubacterium sp. 1001713B170207_170306_E7]|uniref:3-phosphoshikimate 1-carboxyvinyltransferase n=1 Tax=Eubacterium sp. 1001713B170207_170306_E7 TaxID=2787097 RepID=UPI001897E5A7|nr:3-phosphoshikimate 1-carboxyvinyltransferase [Eubacterium sp. 1001713B170207_170306_E7]
MKKVEITPKKLGGVIEIPPSKSVSHRAVMCAALSQGTSVITNILLSEDITATCKAMETLGAEIKYQENESGRYTLTITGVSCPDTEGKTIDCGESGSTLRFIIPLLALKARKSRVIGRGRLVCRPMQPYYDIFEEQGITYRKETGGQELPLCFTGNLKPGTYRLNGSISSQFITGLLFALPLLNGDSVIEITTPLESRPYIDITLDVMEKFGIAVANEDYRLFRIAGNQQYKAQDYRVEGDFSQGAFWLVGGILGDKIDCEDLQPASSQGDKAIVEIIQSMGGSVSQTGTGYAAEPGRTHGAVVDVSQCPDLVPVLTVLAALSQGTTEIVGAARLRFKESDRLAAMNEVLTTLGARITEHPEGMTIEGVGHFTGGVVDSHNDHRIAMAAAIASFACQDKLTITGAESVRKSYPDFWKDFRKMGGIIHEFDLGE